MTFQKGLVSLKMILVLWSWALQQFCCKTYTNSSRVSPVEDLGFLFDLQVLFR